MAQAITPLKRAIFESGRRQYEVAAAVGVSESHLSLVAAGRRQPADDLAERIAAALGRPVEELFGHPAVIVESAEDANGDAPSAGAGQKAAA